MERKCIRSEALKRIPPTTVSGSKEGTMEISRRDLEELIERTSVTTAALVATKMGEQLAKKEEEVHHSPVTPHCERVLGTSPLCWDFRGIRSFVLCKAWDIMEKEKRKRLPVGEGWVEARKVCRME